MIWLLKNLLAIVSKTKRAAFDHDPEMMTQIIRVEKETKRLQRLVLFHSRKMKIKT